MDDLNEQLRLAAKREELLRKQVEELTREIEDMSYAISHDLRAPLRAVLGFSGVLHEDFSGRLEGDGQRYLEIVRSSAQQLSAMVEGILALSRATKHPLHHSDVPVQRIVQEIVAGLQKKHPDRKIEFLVGELPDVSGDMALLQQAWSNLLANAVKFTRTKETAKIEISGSAGQGEVIYTIRDNGAGFDMKYQSKLFGLFQRFHTEKEYEGIGAGLALVKRIIQRHGGRVWAEAKPGEGATFHFALPIKAPARDGA